MCQRFQTLLPLLLRLQLHHSLQQNHKKRQLRSTLPKLNQLILTVHLTLLSKLHLLLCLLFLHLLPRSPSAPNLLNHPNLPNNHFVAPQGNPDLQVTGGLSSSQLLIPMTRILTMSSLLVLPLPLILTTTSKPCRVQTETSGQKR